MKNWCNLPGESVKRIFTWDLLIRFNFFEGFFIVFIEILFFVAYGQVSTRIKQSRVLPN